MVSLFQRKVAIQNAYDKVYLLRTAKARLVESYFEGLTEKIRVISASQQTLDMHEQLSESFLYIESDNYTTPGATNPEEIGTLMAGYYTSEILPLLESRMDKEIQLTSLVPPDNRQQILQYLYIAGNTRPAGFKYSINKAADGSSYSGLHSQYHPALVEYIREAGISDILLVDYKSGYVVYSVKKNFDFATNLYEGPYKNTALGIAFKSAIGLPSVGSFQITDESMYVPAMYKPTFFISAPLFSGSEIKGAVIFAMDATVLDRLLVQENDGPVSSPGLKTYLVGDDLLYRNNDPEMTTDPDRYIRRLKRFTEDGSVSVKADRLKTTAMVQPVDDLAFQEGRHGKEMLTEYKTATGQRVLCSYGPVTIPGLNWILVSQLDKADALRPVHRLTWFLVILAGMMVLLVYLAVHILSNKLVSGFKGLGDFLHALAKGGKPEKPEIRNTDEIGSSVVSASLLSDRINRATAFIGDLGKGDIDQEFEQLGADDGLGMSLNNLKKGLIQNREQEMARKQEEEIRNWSSQGIALFNDILRMDNDNLHKLSMNIIRNIIQYLQANQGGLFLIEEEEGTQYLDLVAAYAFDRHKYLKKRIGIGEGLAGTCVLEKKTILLSRIPEEYIEITSGLGGAKPGCLLIVPLKKEEEILGVLEIASFNAFRPHEVEFMEKIAESIASALITVRLHLQTTEYLERFQQQAEEMKAQDEELRQNIEELQATHEQMEKMKEQENMRHQEMVKEIEAGRKLLIDILDKIPAKIFLKDENGIFVVVNSAVSRVYNKPVEEVIGTTDYDNHPDEDVDSWRKQELEIMEKGETIYIHAETAQGITRHLKTIKMPLRIATTGNAGLLGIQFDVTEVKLLEKQVDELKIELERLKKK
jgi:PAS domain S-box-containing protein